MNDELKEVKEKTLKLLQDWLSKFEEAKEVAPSIQQAYELKSWESEVLDTMPDAATEIPYDHLLEKYSMEQEFWSSNLPQMPSHDKWTLSSGSALSVSSSVSTYQLVARALDLGDPETQLWAEKHTYQYMEMQRQQQRIAYVRSALKSLNPDRASEFDRAVETYRFWSTGWSERESVGIALRNVLEHFKGDLYEKAINRPREQKIKWPQMAMRLAKGGANSPESKTLIAEEETWKSLHRRLTEVAKTLDTGVATNLDMIFTEWIDHLYTVLSLVGFCSDYSPTSSSLQWI